MGIGKGSFQIFKYICELDEITLPFKLKRELMLGKGIVKEELSLREFLVEDILEGKIFKMRASAKYLIFNRLKIGKEVYFVCSPYDPNRCRMITSTDFKMDDSNSLLAQKFELDKKIKERE